MSRYGGRHRLDSNHKEILEGLNELGIGYHNVSQLGGFVGDVVVAYKGLNYIIEIKPPKWKKPRDDRERSQEEARTLWKHLGGQVGVATSVQEVLDIIGYSRP